MIVFKHWQGLAITAELKTKVTVIEGLVKLKVRVQSVDIKGGALIKLIFLDSLIV